MGIAVNSWRIFADPLSKVQFNNRTNVVFKGVGGDTFQSTSVGRFFNENYIKAAITQNPELKQLLKDNRISVKLNMTELADLKQNHCSDTAEISAQIYKNLPRALKSHVNLKDLKDGAMLHDIGKVLIPAEILNKHGKLTEDEFKIMHQHSEIGYQILKNSGVNDEVLSLVRYHHDNMQKGNNFVPDVNLQILNLADKYSALTEQRVYKDKLSPQQALTIIFGDVKKGNVHPMLYNALVKSVSPAYTAKQPQLKVS